MSICFPIDNNINTIADKKNYQYWHYIAFVKLSVVLGKRKGYFLNILSLATRFSTYGKVNVPPVLKKIQAVLTLKIEAYSRGKYYNKVLFRLESA